MLLTIDIGNSYITIGVYEGDTLQFVAEVWTDMKKSADQYACELINVLHLHGAEAAETDGAVISSVVPELTDVICAAIELFSSVRPIILGPGVKTGLNIRIDDPAQLGADLCACAVAAVRLSKFPCIIYDLGTTSTLSVIDAGGRFVGAVIAAGVNTTLEMFTAKTALLPHVSIQAPASVIGKNTPSAMQSGLVYGTAAMLDGLAERIEDELGERAYIIATGSRAAKIAPFCRRTPHIEEHLLLEGLKIIYDKNKGTHSK